MFPTSHPDILGELVGERAERLRAEAARYRRGRPLLARWRPARFIEPAGDLSRVVPAAPESTKAKADRAA
jgi:hypothetical protein